MNEPTEIKYPLDDSGEPYYAATHYKAVEGLDEYIEEKIKDLREIVENQQKEIEKLKG